MRIAYVSCLELPEPDFDQQPLVLGLEDAGHTVEVVAWDDGGVDWGGYDAALIRATWNYAQQAGAFSDWIERAGAATRLINPASTLRWNLHKAYLRQLHEAGIPIVPTAFVDRGLAVSVLEIAEQDGWGKVVIKPAVSAGSYRTRVFDLHGGQGVAAQAFFDELSVQRDVMIQRYMPSVDTVGETSLVVIDARLTHAIEKRPRFDDQDEEVYLRETIGAPMREMAARVIEAAGQECLYARVDVIPDDDGSPLLSELELLEPSLFFPQHPPAVGVFVRGLEKRLAQGVSS